MATGKAKKKDKLRHTEYYDFQAIQDKLYAESMDGKMFTKLVEIITLPENIKFIYCKTTATQFLTEKTLPLQIIMNRMIICRAFRLEAAERFRSHRPENMILL